ncbi:MAG: OmpA family protein [Verrucomicrobiota bacterium]
MAFGQEANNWQYAGSTSASFVKEKRRVKFWVVLALVASAATHVAIWKNFGDKEILEAMNFMFRTEETKHFRVEQVTIDEKLVEDAPSVEQDELASINEVDIVPADNEVDPYEAQKNASDREVRLTPETDEMSASGKENNPQVAGENAEDGKQPGLEEILSAAAMKLELSDVKSRVLDKIPASENQLVLSSSLEDAAILDDPNVADRINETLKKGVGNSEITAGFSNLDELLSNAGPLANDTAPILMPTDLLFAYNSSNLRESARLSLMKLGIIIQRNPDSIFIIEGHTDTLGPAEYNLTLSRRRAESVLTWLLNSLQLDPTRLQVRAYGETRPLKSPDGDEFEQALNRRVEIVIRPKD